MPTPTQFPESFKQMYMEVRRQEQLHEKRTQFWYNVFKFVCVGLILAAGLAWWMVTP